MWAALSRPRRQYTNAPEVHHCGGIREGLNVLESPAQKLPMGEAGVGCGRLQA